MGHESQDFISDVACQRIPALRTCQLRRSTPNMLNTRTDIDDHGLDLVGGFVSEPEHDGVDSAVGGESPYRAERSGFIAGTHAVRNRRA